MKISVLINNHNYGRHLRRAVASVRAQTRPADEIIVVDDGSTDDSLAAARRCATEDPRLRVIAQANGGQLSAINSGFLAATGDTSHFWTRMTSICPAGWRGWRRFTHGDRNWISCSASANCMAMPARNRTGIYPTGISITA